MYSVLLACVMLLGGQPEKVSEIDGGRKNGDFSAQVVVKKWKYDFKKEKWEKQWEPAKSDRTGNVYLKYGTKFGIKFSSSHAYFSNVKVVFEGKEKGLWKLEPWQVGTVYKDKHNKDFVFQKSKRAAGLLDVKFTSRHNNREIVIKLKLVEGR